MLIQGSRIQNYWVAPKSTQPFIVSRSIKWVTGISLDLVVKSKMSPRSRSAAFKQLNPNYIKGVMTFFLKKVFCKKGDLRLQLYQKKTPTQLFSCNICERLLLHLSHCFMGFACKWYDFRKFCHLPAIDWCREKMFHQTQH